MDYVSPNLKPGTIFFPIRNRHFYRKTQAIVFLLYKKTAKITKNKNQGFAVIQDKYKSLITLRMLNGRACSNNGYQKLNLIPVYLILFNALENMLLLNKSIGIILISHNSFKMTKGIR